MNIYALSKLSVEQVIIEKLSEVLEDAVGELNMLSKKLANDPVEKIWQIQRELSCLLDQYHGAERFGREFQAKLSTLQAREKLAKQSEAGFDREKLSDQKMRMEIFVMNLKSNLEVKKIMARRL